MGLWLCLAVALILPTKYSQGSGDPHHLHGRLGRCFVLVKIRISIIIIIINVFPFYFVSFFVQILFSLPIFYFLFFIFNILLFFITFCFM